MAALSAAPSDGGVPVVDVGALVRELGEPGKVDVRALSSEALAAADVLHHVCRGSSGGLIAVNHGFEGDYVYVCTVCVCVRERERERRRMVIIAVSLLLESEC